MEAVVRTHIELFRQNSNYLTIRTRARNRFFYLGAPQLFIEFKHMSSEGTSDMLSPARNLLSVCLENIENPCFTPSSTCFYHFFEIFKSSGPFQHILETYSRYA